jgi:hypothetical protein
VQIQRQSNTIGFTDQRLSPHAGNALFWAWLRPLDGGRSLATALPQPRPTSNNQILPLEKALAFMHGRWGDARKLTPIADLRRNPLVPERLVRRRHRVDEATERGGKCLLDVPGYRFQALVTRQPRAPHSPLAVWRYYHGRADCENVIKELQTGFALPTLCLEQFWATEAALSLASLTYNLTVLFQWQLGWQQKVTLRNLRFWRFVTAGGLSHPAGKTTVKLAVTKREREWWWRLWEKLLSPLPQLPCSRKPTHFLPPILMNMRFQLHGFGSEKAESGETETNGETPHGVARTVLSDGWFNFCFSSISRRRMSRASSFCNVSFTPAFRRMRERGNRLRGSPKKSARAAR